MVFGNCFGGEREVLLYSTCPTAVFLSTRLFLGNTESFTS